MKRQIAGKEYEVNKCNKCGVLLPEEYWDKHPNSEECKRWTKGKTMREKAEKRALG